jgi:hypothetical protein
MAKRKKGRYTKKGKRQQIVQGFGSALKTEGSIKNSTIETGKGVLVGVLGGGLIGAAIGKPSFIVGVLTTGVGHYSGNKLTQMLGIGMMAANGFNKTTTSVSGMDGLDGVKERLQAFKESFSEKIFIDKLKKKGISGGATAGFGDLQYFTYPNGDLAALDDIENQLTDSAMQFGGNLPQGDYAQSGNDFGDISEQNF